MKNEILEMLYTMYPDTLVSGTATRPQLLNAAKNIPKAKASMLMENKLCRGLYALPSYNGILPEKAVDNNDAPFKKVVVKEMDSENPLLLIPATDVTYVPFGIHKDVEKIIKSGMFYPSYIYGPTGNGKSTTIEQICSKLNKPLIRINLNSMTDEDQLIGTKTLVDGNVEIVEGPLIRAMRSGYTILLDEIDAANSNSILCLQSIMEGKPYFFKLKGEMIIPAPGFNIFATANTKGKGSEDGRYIGTNILNEAFLERFAVTFVQDYPSQAVELKIITNIMNQYECVDTDFASDLVKWADAIRRTFADGGIDENITTRRLIHIVRAFSIFKDKKKSIELATNRFDESTRLAFLDLFDKIVNEPEESNNSNDVDFVIVDDVY